MTNIPLKKNDFYYAWASDLNEDTGEGRLARLFLYNFAKINTKKVVVISKNDKYLFNNNKLKILNQRKKIIKLNFPCFFLGIFFSWFFFFKKKKFIYINYLPLWNSLIILLLSPNTIVGPITGSKIFSKNQNIRKLFFPTLYKFNLFFLYIRFKKIIFATDNLRKYVKLRYIQKCSFNFCLLYVKYLKPLYFYDKTIDIIIYNKTHKNKYNNFTKKLVFFLISKKYNIHCFGENLNIFGVKNHGQISNKEAINLIKKSKYMINSGENFYTFFLMESIKYKVRIIYNKKTYPFTKPKINNILGVDYDKQLVASTQILNYFHKS
jgi:hypothetical protein